MAGLIQLLPIWHLQTPWSLHFGWAYENLIGWWFFHTLLTPSRLNSDYFCYVRIAVFTSRSRLLSGDSGIHQICIVGSLALRSQVALVQGLSCFSVVLPVQYITCESDTTLVLLVVLLSLVQHHVCLLETIVPFFEFRSKSWFTRICALALVFLNGVWGTVHVNLSELPGICTHEGGSSFAAHSAATLQARFLFFRTCSSFISGVVVFVCEKKVLSLRHTRKIVWLLMVLPENRSGVGAVSSMFF